MARPRFKDPHGTPIDNARVDEVWIDHNGYRFVFFLPGIDRALVPERFSHRTVRDDDFNTLEGWLRWAFPNATQRYRDLPPA